jgi:cysteine synthase
LHVFFQQLRQYGTAADRAALETEAKVPIISTPQGFNEEELYVDLEPMFGQSLFLKCEGFNFAGSIKLKAATEMVEAAERDGVLTPGSVLVESSSGNLGVALSMIAANKGYGFLCVTDSRCNLSTKRMMQALGSQVHVISEPDAVGGFLGARINYVRALCASDDRCVWLNQYANPQNWKAHYRNTAPAIARQFPQLDVLFVGAGTCGTLMGCAHYCWRPTTITAARNMIIRHEGVRLPRPRSTPRCCVRVEESYLWRLEEVLVHVLSTPLTGIPGFRQIGSQVGRRPR